MSDFRPVTPTLSVAPQISADDIADAVDQGYTLIINNRPDGEEGSQPTNASLAAVAEAKGIKWAHIPVVGGELTLDAIEQLSYALKDTDENKDAKVLAFCRSGTRSCTLWALSQAYTGSAPVETIINSAGVAGYDIANFAPTLAHLYKNATS
ncbi:TIGR01244 family sulfur transferase [Kordiimonas aquimaris]|uniref:TIGR01244 family sulfur transferase n=1 Tax=Kordiimonas aquimaris TaxID=707591 RepID=UPI0021CF121E|nr:TIGR01244 family sulfur transferase [Kordiimonas aquimaris]